MRKYYGNRARPHAQAWPSVAVPPQARVLAQTRLGMKAWLRFFALVWFTA